MPKKKLLCTLIALCLKIYRIATHSYHYKNYKKELLSSPFYIGSIPCIIRKDKHCPHCITMRFPRCSALITESARQTLTLLLRVKARYLTTSACYVCLFNWCGTQKGFLLFLRNVDTYLHFYFLIGFEYNNILIYQKRKINV